MIPSCLQEIFRDYPAEIVWNHNLSPPNFGLFGSLLWQRSILGLLAKTFLGLISGITIFSLFILDDLSNRSSIAYAEQLLLPEYSIKAAFLYNFGKFFEQPAASDPKHISDPFFNVCILGEDPFGEDINAIKGKPVQSRTIRIIYTQSVEQMDVIRKSDLLFICRSEEKHLPKIIEAIKDYPILTVADIKGAAQLGVMINLIRINDSVRFEINLNSAKHVGIKISSQLLKLASSVLE
jgi:hypothetical protein